MNSNYKGLQKERGYDIIIRKEGEMGNTKKLCFAAIMVAVGILLPMVFHAIPNSGTVFAPMHLPVFCAGFICGPILGGIVGLVCPILSFLLTGMPSPAVLPNMLCELFVYGTFSGIFFKVIKTKNFMADVYLSLILSMLLGRLAGGLVTYALYLTGVRLSYTWAIFFTGYFITCWPAILIQIFAIPSVVTVAKKSRFISEERGLNILKRKKPNT